MSKIIINLSKNTVPVPFHTNNAVIGFVNKILGKNNKYHGNEKVHYSISGLMGGKMKIDKDNNYLDYVDGGKIVVSSPDKEFIDEILTGLSKNINTPFNWGMNYKYYENFDEDFINYGYNTFFILNGILLVSKKNIDSGFNKKFITHENTPDYDNFITNHTKKRLIDISNQYGLKLNLNDFRIEHIKDSAKINKIGMLHKGSWNYSPCTSSLLKVYSDKKTAEILSLVGFGKSTRSGFGAACKSSNKELFRDGNDIF